MRKLFLLRPLATTLLTFPLVGHALFAQEALSPTQPRTDAPVPAVASAPVPVSSTAQLIVPAGTRLPLILRNGINTRTAKAGDSVYFETVYPITSNNRIAIPMGTFVRGEILEARRPGRFRGRGEVRMALQQMTYPNGYTVELRASPSSVDPASGTGVDASRKMNGPSSALRDTTAVLLATAGGAYIGTLSGAATNDAPGKGALIGGGVGAIGALIAVLATRGPEAELPRGTTMDVVFDRPLVLDAALLPAAAGPGIDPQPHYVPASMDARDRRREPRRNRTPLPRTLPLLFFPLLR